MKKLILFVSFYFALHIANAGIIEKPYYFDNHKIANLGVYQTISFDNTFLTGKTGEPVLPYSSVSLLLPPGEVAKSIEIILVDEVIIDGSFLLYPQQSSQPLSKPGSGIFKKNEKVYTTNSQYPEKPSGELLTEYMNGYSIALSSFTPVRYNPVSGQLSYYKKVVIKIYTENSPVSVKALQNINSSEKNIKRLEQFIQNSSMISQYPSQAKSEDDYGLMIITPAQFENNFQDLIDIYLERGIKTEVVTKEYISSNSSGQDMQEKIRNYIIQEYQEHSVEFILLGGDAEHIPYRGFYCYVQSGSGYEDNNIPADLYYSGLDGTWNDDNDGNWGEEDEDDLLPDIAVARFPFSNTGELNNMINKSVSYQNNPVLGELTSPLLAGEHLWSGPDTWGADYIDLLVGYQDENGYITIGIPDDQNIETLYERDAGWGGSDLIAKINQGKQFVHHSGHANETSVAHLSQSDITNSNFSGANGTDHNYTILQTHGCNCGDFTYNDCILEKMVTIENFAVAVVGNSRYGWFNEGQTEGPAAHLHREMVDALYNDKLNHIGAAFVECKIQTAPWVTAPGQWEEGALRWNFYDINILGDPALSVWTDEPISIDVNYQNAIPIGIPSTSVDITSGGSPMENFTCAIIKDGVIHGVGYTDATGTAQINFDPVFTNVGDAQLIVSGYNCLPTSYDVTIIPNTGSYVIYSSHQINDSQGNGDGEVDFGESVNLSIEIENVGSQQANDVQVTLTSSENYITITDGFENYGNIAGGTSQTITDAFSIEVASDIPDQHLVNFELEIVGEDAWVSNFNITVNAPELVIGSLSIDDSQGNNDGLLDPGETANIIIESSNFGNSACENTLGTIVSNSSFITISSGTYDVGSLAVGETKQASYTIIVDDDAPIGSSINILNELNSGEYIIQNTFYVSVGLIFEDFETGDFTNMEWEFGGNVDWVIDQTDPYEGDYTAKSGLISHNETTSLSVTVDVTNDDQISFFYKVSCEDDLSGTNWDYLAFKIDNTEQDKWDGEIGWTEASYPVTTGIHTFTWLYRKDGSADGGSDCSWIDYIIFPGGSGQGNLLSVTTSASPSEICSGESSQLNAFATGGTGNFDYQWTPTTGLSDPSISNPIAVPLETTTYTVNVNDGTTNISGQVIITVYPTPETPIITEESNHIHSSASEGNQWYDSNGAIDGATEQDFYPTETDYYYVIVTNEYGCPTNQSNVIYFMVSGVNEAGGKTNILIFPNPSTGDFNINFHENLGKSEIKVMNMLNEIVFEGKTDIVIGESLNINLNNISEGVYFVKIKTADKELIRKIIVQ